MPRDFIIIIFYYNFFFDLLASIFCQKISRETLKCCLNLIDTLHSFHRDNHRFLIDMLQCSPNFNTQHLLSSFWRVPLEGRRGVSRTSYSRHSSISFRSRQKEPGCISDDTDWRGLFRPHHDTISPLPLTLPCFPNKLERNRKSNSVIFFIREGDKK